MSNRRENAGAEAEFFGADDVADRAQHFADLFARVPRDGLVWRIVAVLLLAVVGTIAWLRLEGAEPAAAPIQTRRAVVAPRNAWGASPGSEVAVEALRPAGSVAPGVSDDLAWAAAAAQVAGAAPVERVAAEGAAAPLSGAAPVERVAAQGAAAAPSGAAPADGASGSAPAPLSAAQVALAAAPSTPLAPVSAPPPLPPASPVPEGDARGLDRRLAALARDDGPVAKARAALDRGEFQAALKVLEKHPPAPEVDAMRGRAYFELGRDRQALAALQRARATDPSHPDTLLLLGTVLQSRQDVAGARDAFQTYLQQHPTGAHASEVRSILASL